MRKGLAVSPGVAVGVAYCIHEIFVNPATRRLEENEVLPELARYEQARDRAAVELNALHDKVAAQVGPEPAKVFQVHKTILFDPAFTAKIREHIAEQRTSAPAALQAVLGEYVSLFARTKDEYLRDRVADVRDVVIRLSTHLSEILHPPESPVSGPLILVADELLPSHVMTLGDREVAGVVTQAGGKTSHAAILARSRGIPAVSGMVNILKHVQNGDVVVVDGREGHVIVNPDSETESAYRKLQREFFQLKDTLAANRDLPALSADGEAVELLANINGVADAHAAGAMGATGVGLYRTEYLFLTHHDVPDEQEQLRDYRSIIAASPNHAVTIRTLDLGGDKSIPYLGSRREANPFMGYRSIRLSFEHPEFFSTQIRAILRAAANNRRGTPKVRLMFPMITALEEVRRVRALVRKAEQRLAEEGRSTGKTPIGIMIEVPATAVSIDTFLPEVDFVSIGSNDLVQYLMAADRDNPKVSHLCQPLAPPVLRVLKNVIEACNAAKKPVTLCGEMAGSPRGFVLLFGLGLRSFSMSPAFVPSIKELLSHLTRAKAERIVKKALSLKTTAAVNRYMGQQIAELAPKLGLLDSE
jgi:phosphotransferase system enzyme I (PtsI)